MNNTSLQGKFSFIWDLDGTLLDSYEVIVSSLQQTFAEFGIRMDKDEIHREVITRTVGDLIAKISETYGIAAELLKARSAEISDREKLNIRPIKNGPEILNYLRERDIRNFVFTHRGASTEIILKNTGMYDLFEEIVTGRDGFGRKPDPSAVIYLVRKYDLDKAGTFYVGDRTLDIECAGNAGIKSILYLPEGSVTKPTGKETFIVKDLLGIRNILPE